MIYGADFWNGLCQLFTSITDLSLYTYLLAGIFSTGGLAALHSLDFDRCLFLLIEPIFFDPASRLFVERPVWRGRGL